MKRIILAAALIAPLGTAALACPAHDAKQAASCAEGFTWDSEKGTCTKQVLG